MPRISGCNASDGRSFITSANSATSSHIARSLLKIPQLDGPIPDPYDVELSTPNLLLGVNLRSKPRFLWINAIKSLLYEIWWERNQRTFQDTFLPNIERYDSALMKVSLWASITKGFDAFSIQQIHSNWAAFF